MIHILARIGNRNLKEKRNVRYSLCLWKRNVQGLIKEIYQNKNSILNRA